MLEVVRLKFQWNWPTPGKFTWKVDEEQSCKSQLFKVTNKGKPPRTFPYNLTKNSVEFLPLEISSKKVHGKNVDISTSKITSNKVCGNNAYFLDHRNYIEKVRGNDVEICRNLIFDVLM